MYNVDNAMEYDADNYATGHKNLAYTDGGRFIFAMSKSEYNTFKRLMKNIW